MRKINGKITSFELISYINALISCGNVDFTKRLLENKTRLNKLLNKKIVGLGFSFLEMLSFLVANEISHKPPKLKLYAAELLNRLAINNLQSLNAQTQFSIKCYLGLIPKEQLKEQYDTNFQSLSAKARSTFLENTVGKKLDFCSKKEIQQFMTPLITAICSEQFEFIEYILKNHTEWLHSIYFIRQSSNNIVERIFDPFIVTAHIENHIIYKLIKPYLQKQIAKNLIEYYKNAIKDTISINDQFPKIVKKVSFNHSQKDCSKEIKQDSQVDLIEKSLNFFSIKASDDDLVDLMKIAIELNKKHYLDKILFSEKNFFSERRNDSFSERCNDFFLTNLCIITTKFPSFIYLELVLKEYKAETIVKKKDVIGATIEILKKQIDSAEYYTKGYYDLCNSSSIEAITSILKNHEKIKLLNLDKQLLEVLKRFFKINMFEPSVYFEFDIFLSYAYGLDDVEFFNIIFKYALYLGCKINNVTPVNQNNLLTYLKDIDLEKFFVDLWKERPGSNSRKFFSFLFSSAPSLKLDEKLLPAAITYARCDFFEGLVLANKRPFNAELISALIDTGNIFYQHLLKNFLENYKDEITKMKFADGENIAHLLVRQPTFHSKEFVKTLGSYPELFNQGDANGLTPIHHAVLTKSHSFIEHASFLSNFEFNLNLQDNLGFTALNYTAIQNDTVSYSLLLNYGARADKTIEKQRKMLEFRQRFLAPLSPTPASNATSQQNDANKALHKQANNTHTASIHQSVAKSIQQLMKHYGDPNSEKIKATLKEISDYILSKIKKTKENLSLALPDFIEQMSELLAMNRYINYVSRQHDIYLLNPSTDDNRIIREEITKIPLYKIVVLVWQAAQDMSPEVNLSKALTEEDKMLRLDLLLDRFRRNGRGSNINDTTGKDLGTLDQQLCASEQVNNCVEPLGGLHNLIMILRTPESVQAYFSEKDVMKTIPQSEPVETSKRKFDEPINPITLIGQGDIFKKQKTKSKELEQQEKNPSPK